MNNKRSITRLLMRKLPFRANRRSLARMVKAQVPLEEELAMFAEKYNAKHMGDPGEGYRVWEIPIPDESPREGIAFGIMGPPTESDLRADWEGGEIFFNPWIYADEHAQWRLEVYQDFLKSFPTSIGFPDDDASVMLGIDEMEAALLSATQEVQEDMETEVPETEEETSIEPKEETGLVQKFESRSITALTTAERIVRQKFSIGDAQFQVKELSKGYLSGPESEGTKFWVRVLKGPYKGYKEGEELTMSKSEIESHLGKESSKKKAYDDAQHETDAETPIRKHREKEHKHKEEIDTKQVEKEVKEIGEQAKQELTEMKPRDNRPSTRSISSLVKE